MITVTIPGGIDFKVYLAPEVNGSGKPTFKVVEIIEAKNQVSVSPGSNPDLYDEVGKLAIKKANERVAVARIKS